jgi:hypothetical protein
MWVMSHVNYRAFEPRPKRRRLAALLWGAAITWLPPAVLAQSADSIRISGFGTLGLTDVAAPNGWGYRRDLGQSGSTDRTRGDVDSRVGLQLNYMPVSQFELVTQLLAAPHSRAARRRRLGLGSKAR